MKITNYNTQTTNKLPACGTGRQIINSNNIDRFRLFGNWNFGIACLPARQVCNLCIVVCILFIIFPMSFEFAHAQTEEAITRPKQYDGLWFLGFNLKKEIFQASTGVRVRKSINYAIDKNKIITIMSAEVIPDGPIPPTMLGFDETLKPFPLDIKQAKQMMIEAGYPMADKRLKNLTLLHTDGLKTIEVANSIKKDLEAIGINLTLVEMKYSNQESWNDSLKSGKYDMFLMGYKAAPINALLIGDKETKTFHVLDCPDIPSAEMQVFFGSFDDAIMAGYWPHNVCNPKKEPEVDTYALLKPLFHSEGVANFTFYNNKNVDMLLEQVFLLDPSLKSKREAKFKEINRIIFEDCPTVNFFYIIKL